MTKSSRPSAYMLIVTGKQITQCSIPASFPELTVVINFAKLGALVRFGREGVEDHVLPHITGAQADVLTRIFLTQASGEIDVCQTPAPNSPT